LFLGYFDTRVGTKREAAAYTAILGQIGVKGEEVMFLSDIGEELDAARGRWTQDVSCWATKGQGFPRVSACGQPCRT
jgi:enolase-phosphatase E1